MATGLRFEPMSARLDRVIRRPRLAQLFLSRFDHRVTTVIGAAGFGKSTALALAVDENLLDPRGTDIWLSTSAEDADAYHLLVGVAQALDADPQGGADDIIGQIIDAVWAHAPTDIALIIDDAHHLIDAPALDVVARLVDELPSNGHLVLASRVPVGLRIARLRALGQVAEIGESELDLDDAEVADLCRRRHDDNLTDHAPSSLPRHAATADLQLAAGSDASIDFLWEEILGTLDADRLGHLKRCAVLDALDDELVADVTDGRFDVATLVHGLPLVEVRTDGVVRLHALLREALVSRLTEAERIKASTVAGEAERGRGRHDIAVRHFLDAGNEPAVVELAREFALMPILRQPKEAVVTIHNVMREISPDAPATAALDASGFYVRNEADGASGFRRCAELARERGDTELEAFALHRLLQIALMWLDPEPPGLLDRLRELGTDGEFAPAALAHAESTIAQHHGRTDEAIEALEGYRHLDPSTAIVMRAERLCDLGRPELVGVGLGPDDLATLPPGAEIYISFAMWLRGDAQPELAEAIVADMIPQVTRRGYHQATLSILSVGTSIALASGDVETARRRAEQATDMATDTDGALITLMADVARASLLAVTDSDEAAAEVLAVRNGGAEVREWPFRPHFLALPLVYLVRPDMRPVLDRGAFGPAITTAIKAGQALVAIRTAASDTERRAARALAARLPWNNDALVRVHVLPHHLAELACAASVAGSASAGQLLDHLPNARASLRRVADHADPSIAGVATKLLDTLPAVPTSMVDTDVFGSVRLRRDGVDMDEADWAKRKRVRELWALLLERRRIHRSDVLALLWPGHTDEGKAAANLRTTLSTLQRILEPERDRHTPPAYVVVDRDHLIVPDWVRSSADRFDRLIAAAQTDEQSGLPGRALETYRLAVELYTDDYLADVDAAWAVLTRLRLRSLALAASCRVAELIAAKGEPEQAAAMAQRAQEIDPLSERAGRALISAFDAVGDRTAARAAADHLLAVLADHDIEPSVATRRLTDRLTA